MASKLKVKEKTKEQLALELNQLRQQCAKLETLASNRKLVEKEILRARKNLQKILDAMPFGVMLIGKDKAVRRINNSALRLGGYKSEKQVIGKICHETLCPVEKDKCPIIDLGQKVDRSEKKFVTKDKREIPVLKTVIPVKLDTEEVLLEAFIDISGRLETEKELLLNMTKFRELFNNMSSCVAIYEAVDDGNDFIFKDFNRAAEKAEQIKKEEVINKRVTEVFPAVKEFGLLDVFKKVYKTGKKMYHPISLYKDGKVAGWKENHVYKLPMGELVAMYDDITTRKKVEQLLQESAVKHKALVNNIPGMVYRARSDWSAEIISGSKEICGYTPDELNAKKKRWLDVIHPDDQERVYKEGAGLVKKPKSIIQIYRVIHKNGSVRWIEDRKVSLFTRKGEFAGIEGIVLDITERRRVEEALRKSEKLLSGVFESIQEGISVSDANLTVRRVNKVMERWYANNLPLVGKKCFECYHGKKQPCDPCPTLRCFKSGKTEIEIVPGLPGSPVEWVELYAYPIKQKKSGEVTGVVEFVRDITHRRQAEEELRIRAEILENMVEGVNVADEKGIIVFTNPRLDSMFGYKRGELIGKHSSILNDLPDEESTQLVNKIIEQLKAEGTWSGCFTSRKKDGTQFFTFARVSALKISGKQCWISVQEDITDRKWAEEWLWKSELELRKQKAALEKKNVALSEVLEQVQLEKNKIRTDMATNITEIILPIVEKIRLHKPKSKYVVLLKKSLKEITSSFGIQITEKSIKLTPRELEICNMIKGGLSSKEIAGLINATPKTVEKHRRNIRTKLGIAKKSVNLATFLQTLK